MGIDVYHGTGHVDWKLVKASGHGFGICKATEGLGYEDQYFKENMEALFENGIVRGMYHFLHVSESGKEQADYFINFVKPFYKPGIDIPLVLDLEDRTGTTQYGKIYMHEIVTEFLDEVEKFIKRKPIIYLDTDFANNLLGSGWQGHPLWLGQYTSQPQPTLPEPWKKTGWKFWQYSESGHVQGISGNVVDLDHYNGSFNDLVSWCKSGT